MTVEFVLPQDRGELLRSGKAGQYVVEEVLLVRQLPERIRAFQSAFRSLGARTLLEHFDTPYSVLSHFRSVEPNLCWQTLELLLKVVCCLSSELPELLQDSALPPSGRLDHLNMVKMSCYLVTQLAAAFEDQQYKQELADVGPSGKARKVKPKSGTCDWESERPRVLQVLTQLLQLDIRRLWAIGQVEEDFTRVVTSCCYRMLESPSIGHVKNRASCEAVAHLLGLAIKRYNHMLGATLNVMQLLQHFEHLAPVLAQCVSTWAGEYSLRSIVGEIMREVGAGAGSHESAGSRACAAFLSELADRIPEAVMPNISLVLDLLNGESYSLRNGVLAAMGQMVTRVLNGPGLDAGGRETRDRFLDTLQLHVHDVHAFVRSRSLQLFTHIVQEKALPVKRFQTLVSLATGRLCDKSVNVCKNAVLLLAAILANNPFTWKLSVAELRSAVEKEMLKLAEIQTQARAGQDAAMVLEPAEEWQAMQPEVQATIEEVLGAGGGSDAEEEESVAEGEGPTSICQRVCTLLKGAKYRQAVRLVLKTWEQLPDQAPFSMECQEDDESEGTWPREDHLLRVLEACFTGQPQTGAEPPPSTPDPGGERPLEDAPSERARQEVLVQYLKDTLTFATGVEGAISIVGKFLSSKSPSVVQEAIQFFVTISEFGIAQALAGMRQMLPLVWSKEPGVKQAVRDAYRRLYLSTGGKSSKPQVLVQQLTALLFDASVETVKCLEQLVSDFVRDGEIEPAVIQFLWECLTERVECSAAERRAAVILLGMATRGEPEIVGSNLETLYTVGLGPRIREQQDFQLARDICLTISKLSHSQKQLLSGSAVPFRLPHDHPLFTHIADTVAEGFLSRSAHWRPFAEAAIAVTYQLSEKPDRLCGTLLVRCARLLSWGRPDSGTEEEGADSEVPGEPCATTVPSYLLTNLISLVGQVALQQMLHLERALAPELQRRRLYREQRDAKEKLKGKGKRASCSAMEEELGLTEGAADDTEAELVRKICDVELLDEHQLLSAFVPLIVRICAGPDKYSDPDLCAASALALCKICMVSHDFCESHLRLLVTMLEKSGLPTIRANTMVALGDLSFRFPNLIEPWTPHLYARLRDSSVCVRRTALVVMTHLILKDMVKVKGQISEIAVLLADQDQGIASLARSFFTELSNKDNAVYNLLPDIISRLSDPDCGVEQEPFELIMRQVFSYITRDKQTESLVEKLCQRFRTARLERQYHDLAFCLSLLPPSERGLRKLQENFDCFADKLTDDVVYQHLAGIAGRLHRGGKAEVKALAEEFEQKISRCHNRGLDDGEAITAKPAPGHGKARVMAQEHPAVTPSVRKRRQPSRKTRVVTFSSDESSDSGEEGADADPVSLETETPKVLTPIRRALRARTRACPGDATP